MRRLAGSADAAHALIQIDYNSHVHSPCGCFKTRFRLRQFAEPHLERTTFSGICARAIQVTLLTQSSRPQETLLVLWNYDGVHAEPDSKFDLAAATRFLLVPEGAFCGTALGGIHWTSCKCALESIVLHTGASARGALDLATYAVGER